MIERGSRTHFLQQKQKVSLRVVTVLHRLNGASDSGQALSFCYIMRCSVEANLARQLATSSVFGSVGVWVLPTV